MGSLASKPHLPFATPGPHTYWLMRPTLDRGRLGPWAARLSNAYLCQDPGKDDPLPKPGAGSKMASLSDLGSQRAGLGT